MLDVELKRGRCQIASVHCAGWAARSAWSHCSWGDPTEVAMLLLSITTCHVPRS